MIKTIEEEIVSYLNENDMYFVEEYDKEGFPINDEANDLVGYMTNAELCECVTDAMEYIAEVQHKIDIEKACIWACSQCPLRCKDIYAKWHIGCVLHTDKKECKRLQSLHKAMEEQQ